MAVVILSVIAVALLTAPQDSVASLHFSEDRGAFEWSAGRIPSIGLPSEGFERVDEVIQGIIREQGLPGCGFAIFAGGKLVFSRGYGFADVGAQKPFLDTTLCRLASVSKPITTEGANALIARSILTPDTKVAPILLHAGIRPITPPGRTIDPRFKDITVGELINQRSGILGGTTAVDLIAADPEASRANNIVWDTLTEDQTIGLIMGEPLQSDPGSKDVYSNWGFDTLGKVIEIEAQEHFHLSYEEFYKKYVFPQYSDPKAWGMAHRREADLPPNEAHYYVGIQTPGGFQSPVFADWVYTDLHHGACGWSTSAGNLATYYARLFNFPFNYNGAIPGNQATIRVFAHNIAFAFVTNFRTPSVDTNAVVQQRIGPLLENYSP